MTSRCPRCGTLLSAREDIGPGVLGCTCGVFFVVDDARQKLLAWLHVSDETWSFVLSQGRRGPTCTCGMTMSTMTLKGVVVDGCASCGGLLLDPGELKRLTGLEEKDARTSSTESARDDDIARAVMPERDDPSLGRVYAPSRTALAAFASSRAFHILQATSNPAPGIMAPINEPLAWTLSNGMTSGTITAFDDSVARQLLAFVTASFVSSRFLLRDGRDNPLVVFVRKTRGLLHAEAEVRFADDDELIGTVTASIAGYSLDAVDARGNSTLHIERSGRLLGLLTFDVTSPSGDPIGSVARRFGTAELDNTLLGGVQLARSLRREDFELDLAEPLPSHDAALALAALFLIAQSSHGAMAAHHVGI